MIINAVKYFEKGFHAQSFAFGGEDGAEHFDNNDMMEWLLKIFLMIGNVQDVSSLKRSLIKPDWR